MMKRRSWISLLLIVGALVVSVADGAAAPAGRVVGVVALLGEDGKPVKDRSGAIISLHGTGIGVPDQSGEVYAIHQRNKQFVPQQLVVMKGATIAFPNDDRIDHNVFSLSRVLRFDLGLYRSGTSKELVAKRAGVIDVFCNIHAEMSAKILVLDTPFYAATDAQGRYEIRGVPPGRYTLEVWHPRGKASKAEIVVDGSKATQKSWRVQLGDAPRRHLRKNGTPYGKYR